MQRLLSLGGLLAACSLLPAQNPCAPPPPTPAMFWTLFGATTYLGTPDPVNGSNVFFDLQVAFNLNVSGMDINLLDDGTAQGSPPNLVGRTTTLVVWTVPGTYLGNETTPAAWTQIGTGTLTVNWPNAGSVVTFNPPMLLPAGTWGVALQHIPVPAPNGGPLHPFYTDPARAPGTPLVYNDPFLRLTAGAAQANAFNSGTATPRVVNLRVRYAPASDSAFQVRFGQGCYDTLPTFYERFPAPGPFALANQGLRITNTGAAYTIESGPSALFQPPSPSLTLGAPGTTTTPAAPWDDAVTAPLPLPFPLPFPSGGTQQIAIGSNGSVFLQATAATAPFNNDVTGLLNDQPRHAPFWGDLDLSAGGSLHFDVDPSGQTVYVTWLNVPEKNAPGTANTFQVALRSTGVVEYRYGACSVTTAPVLAGYSPGLGALDPGSRNLLTSLPFVAADGLPALSLRLSARPVLGNTIDVIVSDLRPFTTAGFLVLGFNGIAAGVDLAPFRMPGCRRWIDPVVGNFFLITGPNGVIPWGLPANPALAGTQVTLQGVTFYAGLNAAGLLASNGLCAVAGVY